MLNVNILYSTAVELSSLHTPASNHPGHELVLPALGTDVRDALVTICDLRGCKPRPSKFMRAGSLTPNGRFWVGPSVATHAPDSHSDKVHGASTHGVLSVYILSKVVS